MTDIIYLYTMVDAEVYQLVWKKYLPVIVMKIKEAARKNEPATIKLHRPEFEYAGKKKKVNFQFELEMKNGRAANIVRISSIAKGLSETMRQNPVMRGLMERQHYKLVLDSEFVLSIEVIPYVSAVMSMA